MANLQLRFVDDGAADIRIAFSRATARGRCSAPSAATVPKDRADDELRLADADSDDDELQRVVLHEFGHALGLIHEHQNPQGGIDWNEPAVIADLSGPPNNWDEATIRHNVLDHYPPGDVTATDVDRAVDHDVSDPGGVDERRLLGGTQRRPVRHRTRTSSGEAYS